MAQLYAMTEDEEQGSTDLNKRKKSKLYKILIGIGFLAVLVILAFVVAYLTQITREEIETCTGDEELSFLGDTSQDTDDERLPGDVIPNHYNLTLQLLMPPQYNFTTAGHVEIFIECVQETKVILLHSLDMVIDTVNVTSMDDAANSLDVESYTLEKAFLRIQLKEALQKNFRYILDITFHGIINDVSLGLYRSSYKSEDGNISWIASTQFEPSHARRAFPCFDEPYMKSTFIIRLNLQKGTSSLSNMPQVDTESLNDDWDLVTYEQTPPMSTYLVALTAGKLISYTEDSKQHREEDKEPVIEVWSRVDMARYGEYAQQIAPTLLEYLEDYIGIPYLLPKIDLVSVPSFLSGAMENWGLIIFDETALMYNSGNSSLSNKVSVATIISHELSHQWFGNLVTPTWWNNTWLNEGFATFFEYSGGNYLEPKWKINHTFISRIFDVMETDSVLTSRAIVSFVHADEADDTFDPISYVKGGAIIRMLLNFIGEEAFQKGIKNYLQRHNYTSVTEQNLWQDLNLWNKDEMGVKAAMDTWTSQPGYPVVKFERNYTSKTALVTQKPFVLELDCNKFNVKDERLWKVPVTYTNLLEQGWLPATDFWLTTKSDTLKNLPDKDTWIIGNILHAGYYRVNYDADNWELLFKTLMADNADIDVINRAQILDDIFNLARTDDIDYSTALRMTQYLVYENDYLPWQAVFSAFRYLGVMLADTAAHADFKKFVLNLTSVHYKRIGWYSQQDEDDLQAHLLRQSILRWNCNYGNPDCIRKALNKFQAWKLDPNNNQTLSDEDKDLVFCTGVARGTEDDWNLVFERYNATNFRQQQAVLLKSLTCTNNTELLNRLLSCAMDPSSDMSLRDANRVYQYIAANSHGQDLIFDFLKNSMDQFSSRFGSTINSGGAVIDALTSSFKTQDEIKKLQNLLKEAKTTDRGILKALRNALYKSKNNLKWMNTKYQEVEEWLQHNK